MSGLPSDVVARTDDATEQPGYSTPSRTSLKFNLPVGSPSIQFESLPNISTCSLKAVTTKRAGLGAITGNAKELSDASTRKVLGGNEWVVLPAEDGYSSHIFVDLAASPQLGLSIEYASDVEVPEELVEKQLSTVLKDYFIKEIRAIHYTLAVVDNVKPSNGPTDLVLKSFHFTTLGTSDTASYRIHPNSML